MYFEGETFDDLLRAGLQAILERGRPIKPSKWDALEIIGATLRLTNPLARFSRTEDRGVLFSALGETLWYLSGSDEFEPILHYIPRYRERCETPPNVTRAEAAYGPRLASQMPFIVEKVQQRDTRKAVISIYREADHGNEFDVPCTCTLQFLPRSDGLHAVAQMRSNDAFTGMAHDVFAFTFLHELLARTAGLPLGHYVHQVGSFHLYEDDREGAARYLAGGLADNIPMDPMPEGDPWPALGWLLEAEAALRCGAPPSQTSGVEPYWRDLADLLRVRPLRKAGDKDGLARIMCDMRSRCFRTFLQDELARA